MRSVIQLVMWRLGLQSSEGSTELDVHDSTLVWLAVDAMLDPYLGTIFAGPIFIGTGSHTLSLSVRLAYLTTFYLGFQREHPKSEYFKTAGKKTQGFL